MAQFSDADEVYQFLGGLFEAAFADEELSTAAASAGVVVRMRLSEPESELVIDLPGRQVLVGAAGADAAAAVDLAMSADNAHALWLGRVQPATLIAMRRVKIRGSVRKLLRMQSMGEQLIPVYEKLLSEAGRDDLLGALESH